jgi:hypothetical protein
VILPVWLSRTGCLKITTAFREGEATAEPQQTLFVVQNVSVEASLSRFSNSPLTASLWFVRQPDFHNLHSKVFSVKHRLGLFLQLLVLSVLPALILYQLYFGLELIVMPLGLLAAVVLFAAGTHLREN